MFEWRCFSKRETVQQYSFGSIFLWEDFSSDSRCWRRLLRHGTWLSCVVGQGKKRRSYSTQLHWVESTNVVELFEGVQRISSYPYPRTRYCQSNARSYSVGRCSTIRRISSTCWIYWKSSARSKSVLTLPNRPFWILFPMACYCYWTKLIYCKTIPWKTI